MDCTVEALACSSRGESAPLATTLWPPSCAHTTDDIRKAGKRLKALRKTASAHNKANRIFVYKRDGHNVSEDSLKSQIPAESASTLHYRR